MSSIYCASRRLRRAPIMLALIAGVFASACSQIPMDDPQALAEQAERDYAALPDEKFPVPAVRSRRFKEQYARREVAYKTAEPVGTIIVDPGTYHLYLVTAPGKAMRYGIGVGREGFGWSGTARIARKSEWPRWTPPAEMIAREPRLEPYRNGMEASIDNPLGARAMYLFQGDKDTLYRIHGTNDPYSIGKNVSSGCVRLTNQDVIDLYSRVKVGSKVIVREATPASS
jgi:lipoprotein-anchoring transpeptidase ErfK/SrfK